ncbi:MAG: cytochrome c peroxidase [Bacteroidia bacterium]
MYFFYACKKDNIVQEEITPYSETPYTLDYPYYFPKMSNIPLDNKLSIERTALGRKLYYDPILSNNGLSCSSCHYQSEAFSLSSTNALPHINLGWNSHFLWNGKIAGTVEDIMKFEVDEFFSTDISKLNASEEYRKEFKKAYNVSNISSKEVTYALAQFFRTLISKDSKFDKFFMHKTNLSSPETKGYVIFNTEKGDCFHCHSLGLFTDNFFHNIGIDSVFDGVNRGRFNYTGNAADMGLFKTPTLRNIEMTAPYMHDGRFKTLEEVVEHYNSGVKLSHSIDPIMTKAGKEFGLRLTSEEKSDLVAFLKTLTDSTFLNNPTFAKP